MLNSIKHLIPKKRLFIYLLVIGFLPFGACLSYFFFQNKKLDQIQEEIENSFQILLVREKKELPNRIVRNHYKEADHFYIDKYLEKLPLLKKETESLKKILISDSLFSREPLEQRLHFLTKENRISFTENSRHTGNSIEEVFESLSHPVEVDNEDLLTLLSRIEEKQLAHHQSIANSPQLIITEFHLSKKKQTDNTGFMLHLKLLKREFL